MARVVLFLAALAVLAGAACNKAPAPAAPAPPPSPSCELESGREIKLGAGTEMRVWNLKVSGLTRLAARLLVGRDGQVQTASEVEYKWESGAPAGTAQVVLLIQDGKAFGAKGVRLSKLALDAPDAPSRTMSALTTDLLLKDELHPWMTSSSNSSQRLGEKNVLYAQAFAPPNAPGRLPVRRPRIARGELERRAGRDRRGAGSGTPLREWRAGAEPGEPRPRGRRVYPRATRARTTNAGTPVVSQGARCDPGLRCTTPSG